MKISEEFIAGYRELTACADREAAGCPDSATLSALAAGELDAETRDRILGRIAGCSDCATELRLAMEIRAWSEASSKQADSEQLGSELESGGQRGGFRPAWATLAAALLAIVIGSWWWVDEPSSISDRPELRQAGVESRAAQPADGSTLETAPRNLQWPGVVGAEAYRAQVLDATGKEIWQSPWVTGTDIEPAWGDVPPGTYLWTVEVRGPVSRKQLGPFSFNTTSAFKLDGAPVEPTGEPAVEPRAQ